MASGARATGQRNHRDNRSVRNEPAAGGYPHPAPIANRWHETMGMHVRLTRVRWAQPEGLLNEGECRLPVPGLGSVALEHLALR